MILTILGIVLGVGGTVGFQKAVSAPTGTFTNISGTHTTTTDMTVTTLRVNGTCTGTGCPAAPSFVALFSPPVNNTYDLGSPTSSMKNVYASGTGSYLVGVNWTNASGSTLYISGLTQLGSITGSSLVLTGAASSVTSIVGSAGVITTGVYGTSTWIDFPAVAAGTCSVTSTVTLAGVQDGDVVKITSFNATKNASTSTEPEAYIQASNTIAVRLCNRDKIMPVSDPATARYGIRVQSIQ